MNTYLSVFRTASVILLIASAPIFPAMADTYSEFVTGLQPDIYYRFDEDTISAPEAPNVGSPVENHGTGGTEMAGHYQTCGGSLVKTTKPSGGAIPGNAGVKISGQAVQIPRSVLASGTEPFSLSIWVRPNTYNGGMVLNYGDEVPNGNALLLRIITGGQLIVDRFGVKLLESSGRLVTGEWNAIGVTYDGKETLKVFINGLLDSTYSGDIAGFGNLYAAIGDNCWMRAEGWQFSGGLDEFAYWKGSALPDKQMVRLADPSAASKP
jgi:hypothetical protein